MTEARRPERMPLRAGAGLFLAAFSFYALTGPGHLSSVDGSVLLHSAQNLTDTGSAAVPRDPSEHSETITPRGVDGLYYPVWGPGLVLAHLPTLFIARHLESLRPVIPGRRVSSLDRDKFYAPFTCAWLMAAAVTGIALCGSALGFPLRVSMLLAALMAVGSPLWHYARFDTNEPLQCAALMGATYCLLRGRSALGPRDTLFAGAFLGVAVAAKAVNVIVLPWFFLYAVAAAPRSRALALAGMAAPLFAAGGALAALNVARYGSPFETGYHVTSGELFTHPLLDGASVLLFSPGFGLLVFTPAFLLLPLGGREFVRRFRLEAGLVAAVFVCLLVVNSKFYAYWGCAWGPRFLVPAAPMLSLALLPIVARRGWRRMLLISAFFVGIGVQSATIGISFWGQIMPVWGNLAVPVSSSDPKAAAVERIETLVHAASATPLRVALWLLANTGCREAGQPLPPLTTPPWAAEFPWQDPEQSAKLAHLAGLDLWAVPRCWRPPLLAAVLPSNPRLRWLLLGVAAVGAGLLASELRREVGERQTGSFR